MESQARALGAVRSFLDTFAFQAAPFYAKNGYVEVARVLGYWGEHDRIYMAKAPL